jgi:hypothetical protein
LPVKGGRVGDIKSLKKALKRSSGAGTVRFIPKEQGIEVRFITEPIEWFRYTEHFDSDREQNKAFPCTGDTCEGCEQGLRGSTRFLASVVDVGDGNSVVPLAMPVSIVTPLVKLYDKFGTLMDRNYELTRDGDGLNTTYMVTPEVPTKMNLRRYKPLDLEEILQGLVDDEDDEEEEETPPPRRAVRKSEPVRKARPRPTVLDDDEDDEEATPTRKRVTKSSAKLHRRRPTR